MMLTNRTALITGGTKGIGRAVAELLLAESFDVILTFAHDEEAATSVLSMLRTKYPTRTVRTVRSDATDLESIPQLVETLGNETQLDALVLNAGTTDRTDFEDIDPLVWQKVFTSNVHYPTFLIQALLGHFAPNASIVFTGSSMGIHPHSVSLSYGVTKATTHALVRNLVKFLAPRGIRVNAVAPGFVDTEWQKAKPAEVRASINSKIALGRFCSPEELAQTYYLLIANQYLNGEVISVDGGYSFR